MSAASPALVFVAWTRQLGDCDLMVMPEGGGKEGGAALWKGEGGREEESVFFALRSKRRALLSSASAAAVEAASARRLNTAGMNASTDCQMQRAADEGAGRWR